MPSDRLRFVRPLRRPLLTTLLVFCSLGTTAVRSEASDLQRAPLHEIPQGPLIPPSAFVHSTSPAATVSFGRFTSVQANVDVTGGANILGDAANEPSIAVDPTNPSRMAIGWRQFDTVQSTFREAGYGYTTDGGLTWRAGKIDPGVFHSDPVLSFDAQGNFFYMGLTILSFQLASQLFASTDHGATWGSPVPAFGGDKEWMTIDRNQGPGSGNIYETWASDPPTFSRSVDGGHSFQSPTSVPFSPNYGTMDVGPDGTLYLVGTSGDLTTFYVSRSTKAKFAAQTPTFTTVPVNMGGTQAIGVPNPDGLLGQPWIAVDPSKGGPESGWVYVLCSVHTPTDPLDVMFVRSTDGGQTWSSPVRVNDDPGHRAYQWFGTMSVAPNGRIDAVWNDTRGSGDKTKSALYYSFSNDGGVTWSRNEQLSPVWDSSLGWHPAAKIGDYYHMISSNGGADLAWAATFNGEQDVYYLRIPAPSALAAGRGTTASTSTAADRGATDLRLLGNSPNPFAASTTIQFDMSGSGGRAKIEVFDAGGRRVTTLLDGFVKAGSQSVHWTGADDAGRPVKSGVYVCRVEAAGTSKTLKLTLMR